MWVVEASKRGGIHLIPMRCRRLLEEVYHGGSEDELWDERFVL